MLCALAKRIMTKTVYLDHNATSPLRPAAREAIVAVLEREGFGNPSSVHRSGVEARYLVEKSRRAIARAVDCSAERIVFTSGGTESDNLAIRGTAFARRKETGANRIVTSAAEHKAVLDTCIDLRDRHGFDLTILPVDEWGRVDPGDFRGHLSTDVAVVSVIHSNNETGAINDVPRLVETVGGVDGSIPFHTDAVQALGRVPFSVNELGADLVSLCAHKFGGPVGVGVLVLPQERTLWSQVTGGGQEQGYRGGTENVSLIAGFAAALAEMNIQEEGARIRRLRDDLWTRIQTDFPNTVLNTPLDSNSLAGTLNVSFPGVDGQKLVRELDRHGIAVSAGSACTSAGTSTSHVIRAMTRDTERIEGAIRISLGWSSTQRDLDLMATVLPSVLAFIAT